MRLSSAIGALMLSGGLAHAQGCPPVGGETIAEIEELNQLVVDSKFEDLEARVGTYLGMDMDNMMFPLASIYADGFTGCTTVAQRSEVGGLVQTMVVYDGAVGPLFGYWMSMTGVTGFRLLTFDLNTDLTVVTDRMK